MSHYHAVIWIDHHEARIFEFTPDDVEKETVRPKHPVKHLHAKPGTLSSWRAPEDKTYYTDVAKALGDAGEILVTGPANAKLVLVKYLQKHNPKLAEKIIGVETVDHPTDRQMVAFARNYFKHADRMLPQID